MTTAAPGTSQAIANKEKAVQALGLRKNGATYDQIANMLGYASRGSAYRAVQRLLKAHEVEEVDELRKLEDGRLDDMLVGIYKIAKAGDLGAIDRILRIAERRAKLWGLDMPVKQEVTGKGGGPIAFAGSLANYELGEEEAGTIFDELERAGAFGHTPADAETDALHPLPPDA